MPLFANAAFFFALSIGIRASRTASSQKLTGYEINIPGFAFLLTCSPLYIALAFPFKAPRRGNLCRSLTSVLVTRFCCANF